MVGCMADDSVDSIAAPLAKARWLPRVVVGQSSAGLAFHEQGHELADLRVVEPGIQGLDDLRDVGSGATGVGRHHSRNHLGELRGFIRLAHELFSIRLSPGAEPRTEWRLSARD